MKHKRTFTALVVLAALATTLTLAQRLSFNTRYSDPRAGVPDWDVDPEFANDVFTFVRIQWSSGGYRGGMYGGGRGYYFGNFRGGGRTGGRGGMGGGIGGMGGAGMSRGRGGWATDYPDSDYNFSYRLHQLTSMQVDPDGLILELTDPELFNYPFIYMLEVGSLVFSPDEVAALRRYLLNGGFLMVDDFWGQSEWLNFYREIKRIFPDREPVDVPLEHPIFHAVFDLKKKPQIPSINDALNGRASGRTWEEHGADSQTPHYRAIYDDNGRIMVFICHNTDLGDGWEREGENEWYFHEFSEKQAYPMGINIVFYAMTH